MSQSMFLESFSSLVLSKEVLEVSVGQRIAKLWTVDLWGWYQCLGIEPWQPTRSVQNAEPQNFLQISNF